jgi:hypothetical protein
MKHAGATTEGPLSDEELVEALVDTVCAQELRERSLRAELAYERAATARKLRKETAFRIYALGVGIAFGAFFGGFYGS